jgi:hypothetical protein
MNLLKASAIFKTRWRGHSSEPNRITTCAYDFVIPTLGTLSISYGNVVP